MRSVFLHICAFCAVLLFFPSCSFDKEKDYVFHYEVQANLLDESGWEILEEYFKENYVNESKNQAIHATYYEACQKALLLFEQGRKEIDYTLILNTIQDPDDVVYLIGVLTGGKSNEIVNSTYWDYDLKQKYLPEITPE